MTTPATTHKLLQQYDIKKKEIKESKAELQRVQTTYHEQRQAFEANHEIQRINIRFQALKLDHDIHVEKLQLYSPENNWLHRQMLFTEDVLCRRLYVNLLNSRSTSKHPVKESNFQSSIYTTDRAKLKALKIDIEVLMAEYAEEKRYAQSAHDAPLPQKSRVTHRLRSKHLTIVEVLMDHVNGLGKIPRHVEQERHNLSGAHTVDEGVLELLQYDITRVQNWREWVESRQHFKKANNKYVRKIDEHERLQWEWNELKDQLRSRLGDDVQQVSRRPHIDNQPPYPPVLHVI
ncbi:hypothetical protein G6011_08089 [Alternaria panax]|uniref:Uncharacterized protein n=1 Tax=Alternaria panax TaxID=48097 RepID=A0AAD4I9J2_9PLEO|nr:hypothetical protein G6011_08089 [Alternaria panax]